MARQNKKPVKHEPLKRVSRVVAHVTGGGFAPSVGGELKIDLACGQTPREGFRGADLFAPNPDMRMDVLQFPWRPMKADGTLGPPLADNSVDELHCSHFIEHIPMGFIDDKNVVHATPALDRRDLFFAFFDEAFRVLKNESDKNDPKSGGRMTVIVPYLKSTRAFQDPTHRRFICEETFLYLVKDWRNQNRLDHYGVKANFDLALNRITDPLEAARPPEVALQRGQNLWNVVNDLEVKLYKRSF